MSFGDEVQVKIAGLWRPALFVMRQEWGTAGGLRLWVHPRGFYRPIMVKKKRVRECQEVLKIDSTP